MTLLDASGLADALADERLLEPEQFEEFTRTMLSVCSEPIILAKELIYREWLTPFQAEQILSGHADSLVLGSYILLEPIGQGGMGCVFRARNWKLNRIVALKHLGIEPAKRPASLARFQREFRALGKVQHPHIVKALDADFQGDTIFYVMEYFDGTDLSRYVRTNGPLPVGEAAEYVLQTADALQHAHEAGLIHRDVKPSNLLLTEPEHLIKVLDLGLSRCESPTNDSVFDQLTRAGAIIGTPDYMSPEQVREPRRADIRSDLYSLGCTFHFLLAGKPPFEHLPAMVDKLYAQCEAEPTPIEQLRPDVPAEIATIVHKLLAKRPRDRFRTPADLMTALQRAPGNNTLNGLARSCLARLSAHAPQLTDDRTELLSPSELAMVSASTADRLLIRPAKRRRHMRFFSTQLVAATLLALVGMLMVWQFDLISGRDHGTAPPLAPGYAQPDDPPPAQNGDEPEVARLHGMPGDSIGDVETETGQEMAEEPIEVK